MSQDADGCAARDLSDLRQGLGRTRHDADM